MYHLSLKSNNFQISPRENQVSGHLYFIVIYGMILTQKCHLIDAQLDSKYVLTQGQITINMASLSEFLPVPTTYSNGDLGSISPTLWCKRCHSPTKMRITLLPQCTQLEVTTIFDAICATLYNKKHRKSLGKSKRCSQMLVKLTSYVVLILFVEQTCRRRREWATSR